MLFHTPAIYGKTYERVFYYAVLYASEVVRSGAIFTFNINLTDAEKELLQSTTQQTLQLYYSNSKAIHSNSKLATMDPNVLLSAAVVHFRRKELRVARCRWALQCNRGRSWVYHRTRDSSCT